jgi:hypothetical protein
MIHADSWCGPFAIAVANDPDRTLFLNENGHVPATRGAQPDIVNSAGLVVSQACFGFDQEQLSLMEVAKRFEQAGLAHLESIRMQNE